jgi:hypothetical protein
VCLQQHDAVCPALTKRSQSAQFQAGPAGSAAGSAASDGALSAKAVDAERVIDDTTKFIFQEYDGDKDGLMTRKEFFTVRACVCMHVCRSALTWPGVGATRPVFVGAQERPTAQADRGPDD